MENWEAILDGMKAGELAEITAIESRLLEDADKRYQDEREGIYLACDRLRGSVHRRYGTAAQEGSAVGEGADAIQ